MLFISIISASAYAQKEKDVVEHFRSDIEYLASDQLQGRLTGSAGELKSSVYIADEFRKYNLSPMGDSGSYLQGFKIIRLRMSQGRVPLLWTDVTEFVGGIRAQEGSFYPLSPSVNNDSLHEAPVFQAGYGIMAPELNHNDYKDTSNIRGKVFVIKLGSPEAGVAHSKFTPHESITNKVDLAIRMGARGVVFVKVDSAIDVPKGMLDRNVKPRNIPVIYVNKMQNSILKAKSISFSVKIVQLEATAHNVVGFINNKKKKTIVIGAHQDHLGYNEYGGSLEANTSAIHNGADDNASGVAMMLELMRTIKKNKKLRRNNYIFIAFSGEEQGLIGSKYFVDHPPIGLRKVKYMLNFDMVGRLDSAKKTMVIYGTGTSRGWNAPIASIKTDTSQIRIKTVKDGTGPSDHTSFFNNSIPALHFFSGQHYDYHKPSDDAERINYHGMYLCYEVVMQVIRKANKSKDSFVRVKTENEEKVVTPFKVTLGIMPDYVYDGNGIRVDGVTANKPADKAGIVRGDVIIRLGDFAIANMDDYMKALGYYSKGETVKVKIRRGSEEKELTLTF